MSKLQKSKEAWKRYNRYIEETQQLEMHWWNRAEDLYFLKKSNLYKNLFGGHDATEFKGDSEQRQTKSWNSFCGEALDDIPVSTANYMIRNYETYIVDLELKKDFMCNFSHSKLEIARPYVNKKNIESILSMIKTLSRSDLRKELEVL